MSTRLIFIFEKRSGNVVAGVELDKDAYPDRDEFVRVVRAETEALRKAHLPNEELGFFEGGAKTTEDFFRWSPDFELPDSAALRKLPEP